MSCPREALDDQGQRGLEDHGRSLRPSGAGSRAVRPPPQPPANGIT